MVKHCHSDPVMTLCAGIPTTLGIGTGHRCSRQASLTVFAAGVADGFCAGADVGTARGRTAAGEGEMDDVGCAASGTAGAVGALRAGSCRASPGLRALPRMPMPTDAISATAAPIPIFLLVLIWGPLTLDAGSIGDRDACRGDKLRCRLRISVLQVGFAAGEAPHCSHKSPTIGTD